MVAKSMLKEILGGMPPGLEEAFLLSEVSIEIYLLYCLLMHFPKLLIT